MKLDIAGRGEQVIGYHSCIAFSLGRGFWRVVRWLTDGVFKFEIKSCRPNKFSCY